MQKVDFNLTDAYKIFDGKLGHNSLKEGLDAIGVFPTAKEIVEFFQRYDKNQDDKLSFEEFAEAFTPMNEYYAHVLSIRPTNHRQERNLRRDDVFVSET